MQVSQAGCKGRATSVGEAVDVTCTEHNHPQDQASNKAKKLMSSTRKGQYSLSDYLHAIEYRTVSLCSVEINLPPEIRSSWIQLRWLEINTVAIRSDVNTRDVPHCSVAMCAFL